ncbi:AraC family transcriptional regulator ligand-binding domain-containing protein [Phyllobacterium lublinensis]|uniref:AraC family transcriptional regulator ligand-binding domain-containing protein n=1 Tax=Phyllobacterium lublinensis TaxID=2875708 RepID=UPI001CCAADF4|nr:AraC family transcriptional regulator ligand-binding domain-containing protein [Phyllobacterium sp. 2063]MBZ9653827.1 AraC family transcriptional regulator [Phyllobacterium sp. 2063]
MERAGRVVEDDWFGLTLANDFDLRELGLLYYVAASSERLGDALKRLDRYERIANEALDLRIVKGPGGLVGLCYKGVPRHLDRHLMESFAVAIVRLCRQLAGRKVVPLSESFVHRRADDRKIQQLLSCEANFDAPIDEMRFEVKLNLSERTFARRLAAEGLSFGEILDHMRCDLAIRYLK